MHNVLNWSETLQKSYYMLKDFKGVSYHFGILCITGLRVEVDVGQNHSRRSDKKKLAPPAAEIYLEPR